MLLMAAVTFVGYAACSAATIQTIGAGSAVSLADRIATFDALTATNTIELGNYAEGGLRITTGSQNWGADPPYMLAAMHPFGGIGEPNLAFFGMANGTAEWVIIETVNAATMHGVEFMYGNTWSYQGTSWGNDQAYVVWQTLLNGTVLSTGQVGPSPLLPLGTVIGFYDPAGFDQLQVKCLIANSSPPDYQAIALDNVSVQLTNLPPAPIISAADFSVDPANGIPSLTVWDTLPGLQYRLVYSESFVANTWTPVTPPLPSGWVPGGGVLGFTDSGAPGRPCRYYRVEVR